ncbi:bifunctional diguanylate cyclase/phosphodiesterase [Oryzifoliimicrobium ureilyticus]|uniref:bifunctional diguanylate cyclase/phosphodiesterase n=1 Tax=Oryzifoliimicrobium ureilyticus TaxID=3113724 RepID=UPI00307616D3
MFSEQVSQKSFSGERFTRHIVVPTAALLIIAITLVLAFLIISADRQNKLEVVASTRLAHTALAVKTREVARNLKDYAVWEDVYNNLYLKVDTQWAGTDGNIGKNIFEGLGYEAAFVISNTGKTVYSVIEGKPQEADAFAVLSSGLPALLQRARTENEPLTGMLKNGSDVVIVAATPILPPSIDRNSVDRNSLSILVFSKKINESFLSRMGQDYLLNDLAINPPGSHPSAAHFDLNSIDGEDLGAISWVPAKPGYQLLPLLAPPLAICAVILMAFAVVVVRNIRRSSLALEASAKTVAAYAQTLQESEARFKDVAEASSDWIWECDSQLQIMFLSTRFSEVTGIAAANVLGKTMQKFFQSESDSGGWTSLMEDIAEGHAFRDLRCLYKDARGMTRICRLAGRPIKNTDGAFIGFRGTATDITKEVEAQARASHFALHDALTGLPNRVLFRERLNSALNETKKAKSSVSVICLDLDHFKEVNDTLGHGAGDILLRQLSQRLLECVRASDTVARLGGDEFAIIQVGVDQAFESEQLSRKLIEVVKQPFEIEAQELHVGVSLGIAFGDTADGDAERLLKNADIALYRAKQAGRATFCVFEPQMDQELQERKALEHDLRQAVLKNQLELHYQPLIDVTTKKVVAVEALVRWRHPSRGLVPPSDFIPMAEETGLVIAIGEWVLDTACRQALQWPDIRVAVNLSPVQFRSRDLIGLVTDVLARTGLEPGRLELEITESVLINDVDSALSILNALKDLGVKIAMDDFGTGYSSLGYLNSFPFDKIKIDKSFIGDMSEKDKSGAIVKSVISLGQSLNMITTAEGVETAEQASFLKEEGCHQLQGYLFSRPVSASELESFISNWSGDENQFPTEAAA